MSHLRKAGLGIDIGTTGMRLSLIRPKPAGEGVAGLDAMGDPQHIEVRASLVARGSRNKEEWHEQDPFDWWRALEICLKELSTRVDLDSIDALAIDGTSGTILLCDALGAPLTPGIMYDDRRAVDEAEGLARFHTPGSIAHTASSPLAKTLWLLRNRRRDWSGKVMLTHQADWLAGKITGRFGVTDENNALKSGYDPSTRAWPGWITEAGCPQDMLPAVRPIGSRLGDVGSDFAKRYGFSRKCKVLLGTTDSVAAFLATSAEKIGDASTSWGTTLAIKMLVPRPIVDNDSGVYSHRLGDRWLVGGASNVGGAILLKHFESEEIDLLSAMIDPDRPTGCSYYPLAKPGERFPICDPAYPPRLEPRPGQKHLFLQAIFEGMAEVERLAYAKIQSLAGVQPKIIYSTGGVTRNRTFNAIRTRILKQPIVLLEQADASFGMARLALRAIQ